MSSMREQSADNRDAIHDQSRSPEVSCRQSLLARRQLRTDRRCKIIRPRRPHYGTRLTPITGCPTAVLWGYVERESRCYVELIVISGDRSSDRIIRKLFVTSGIGDGVSLPIGDAYNATSIGIQYRLGLKLCHDQRTKLAPRHEICSVHIGERREAMLTILKPRSDFGESKTTNVR